MDKMILSTWIKVEKSLALQLQSSLMCERRFSSSVIPGIFLDENVKLSIRHIRILSLCFTWFYQLLAAGELDRLDWLVSSACDEMYPPGAKRIDWFLIGYVTAILIWHSNLCIQIPGIQLLRFFIEFHIRTSTSLKIPDAEKQYMKRIKFIINKACIVSGYDATSNGCSKNGVDENVMHNTHGILYAHTCDIIMVQSNGTKLFPIIAVFVLRLKCYKMNNNSNSIRSWSRKNNVYANMFALAVYADS